MSFVDPEEEERKEAEAKANTAEAGRAEEVPAEYPLIKVINELKEVIDRGLAGIATAIAGTQPVQGAPVKDIKAPAPPAVKAPAPAPVAPVAEAPDAIATIIALFPANLSALLKFEVQGDNVRIAPKKFLGSDNFAKIASVVRNVGGEYKSAGKESHFIVPKPK